jgi:hypothetical protein
MKKTILVILMVTLVATPCFAQEVEPDGAFSIDGTEWSCMFITTEPPFIGTGDSCIGFYEGKVYGPATYPFSGLQEIPSSFYINLGVVSFFMGHVAGNIGQVVFVGILQPIGIGVDVYMGIYYGPPFIAFSTRILTKINDNWTPPGVE